METQLQLRSIFETIVKKDDDIISINANVATADILKQIEEVIHERFDNYQ
jgi:thymidylate kinase